MVAAGPDGIVVVDKPQGWTSHDVVARMRRLAGTRKVGHAGTLDPMATGVLVLGLGRATRLLGYLAAEDKQYLATMRLGQSTLTDDAEGEIVGEQSAADVTDDAVREAVARLTGELQQVPSSVSAIKVDGRRAYSRVRSGEDVALAARPVTVTAFEVQSVRRPTADLVDVDVSVTCSSGTYVRALARDVGGSVGVGGHLTVLRRTRVGSFRIEDARTLEELERRLAVIPVAAAVDAAFPRRAVGPQEAAAVAHGRFLPLAGESGPTGVFGPDGAVLALMGPDRGELRPLVVFVG